MANDMFGIGNQLDTLVKFVNNNIILILKRLYNLYKFVTKFILKTFKFLPLTIPIFGFLFLFIIFFVRENVNAMLCLLCYIALIIILSAISIYLFIKIIEILELIIIKIIKEKKKYGKAEKAKKSSNQIKAVFSLIGLCLALLCTLVLILICGFLIKNMANFNNYIYEKLNTYFNISNSEK